MGVLVRGNRVVIVMMFGGNSDREIIKCGSYIGNGSSTGPDIKLGWEPQFIIVKQIQQ